MTLRGYRRSIVACVAIATLAGGFVFAWRLFNKYYVASSQLHSAYASYLEHDLNEAEQKAWHAYQLNGRLSEAALLAMQIANESGRYDQAKEYAQQLAADASIDQQTRIQALRLLAQISHQRLYQLSQAESHYRSILSELPDDIEAQTGLANLLGLCGRRPEAIPLVLNLVRLGSPSDLLMLLAREDAVVNNQPLIEQARKVAPNDPLPLLAQAWQLANDGQYDPAIRLLRQACKLNQKLDASQQLMLRYLAADARFEELRVELVRLQSAQGNHQDWADYWLASGQLAESEQRLPEAIRCYGEAAMRAPDSKAAISRLAALLHQAGEPESAKVFQKYAEDMQSLRDAQEQVFFTNRPTNKAAIDALLDAYIRLGRAWEALGWCQITEGQVASSMPGRIASIQSLTTSQPLRLVLPNQSPCRHLELSKYPIPRWSATAGPKSNSIAATASAELAAIEFRDDAAACGLVFRYDNGVIDEPKRRMYEFPGGGIAVLDFDQDGRPDIATSQGTSWPPEQYDGALNDIVWRNLDGIRFESLPHLSLGFQLPDRFGQGVSTGDFNCDGFADLYIAEIGQNHLLVNNGDGTFQEVTLQARILDNQWTTSCMIADLNGDGLPDLYDVNYVSGSDVFDRVCSDYTNQPAMCMPGDFDAARQKLWINQGDGVFLEKTDWLEPAPIGKGLGCLAFASPSGPGLSLLVANDTTPNLLYMSARSPSNQLRWTEQGVISGLAYNAAGKAQGSMGIAASDLNLDGQLDFVITNFLNESSTYYQSQSDHTYRDLTTATSLAEPTRSVLGFGAQFIDANNDGAPELFMANGHIDDLRRRNVPYEMPPQLFQFSDGRFQLLAAQSLGSYFQRQHLGRAVVRIDWNNDGRQDLIVGHLNEPYALLTNTTPKSGNWLTLQLIGTESNRDAIGSQVTVTANRIRYSNQLTAGDGYMASNQRQLHFGIGTSTEAELIEIDWPSGNKQTLHHIPAGSQLLIVEETNSKAASR